MSFEDGWAAIHLQMPKRIPRSEFDADSHWELVKKVTGIDVGVTSPAETRAVASRRLRELWNYDIMLTHSYWVASDFGPWLTNMGHAEYAAGGVDRNDNIVCPFQSPEEVLAFDPVESLGHRTVKELAAAHEKTFQQVSRENPFAVCCAGIYHSCFTGLIQLFGWDMMLMAAGIDPDGMGRIANRYAEWVMPHFEALAKTSAKVIYVHDDLVWTTGPVLAPAWYRKYIFPNYRKFFAPLRDAGKKILFVCDGNYDVFVDDVAACGASGFFFEPLTSLERIAERYGKTHFMIGNVDTRILLSGTKAAIRAEVERCMSIGRNCPGYFMGVTNMIPHNTPVDNAIYYNEMYEKMCKR